MPSTTQKHATTLVANLRSRLEDWENFRKVLNHSSFAFLRSSIPANGYTA